MAVEMLKTLLVCLTLFASPRISETYTCTSDTPSLANGTISCINKNQFESSCNFICNEGYYMSSVVSTCGPGNQWSLPQPFCRPITCLPPHKNPTGGSVSCTRENFYGSVCRFACDHGYEMIGRPRSLCEQIGELPQYGGWSNPAPTCKENLCDETLPLAPEIGFMSCTNDNILGSVCTFFCNRFHTRIGPANSTCVETPKGPQWSHGTPTCEPDLCQPPREQLRNGVVTCTKGNLVTSVCTFACTTPGYHLYPPDFTTNRCMGSKMWNRRAPCCSRLCPPYAKMDAIFILDSSSSVGRANWILVKRFVQGMIQSFVVSDDSSRFAVIRYNRAVDTQNQILLKDYPNNKTGLLAAVDRLPYDGSGTRTGQAIKYAGDVIMTPENGDRPNALNVLIVLTDGRSQDNVLTPSKALRKRGVFTFAVGIRPPRGKLDMKQLVEIAGNENAVLTAASFESLADITFTMPLIETICGDPCDQ